MQSGFFKLNIGDLGKSLGLLLLATVLQAVLTSIQQDGWHQIITTGFWATTADMDMKILAAYLLKQFFTDSDGKFLGKIG